MRLPTASAIDTAMECLGSCVLRRADAEGEYAATGTEIHAYLQHARADKGKALAMIEDPGTRERCEAIDLSRIPAGASSEVALAWDLATDKGEMLALAGRRMYPAGEVYCGTADLVGRLPDGAVWIGDFKSGTAMAACDSWQLKTLALMAARAVGADRAEVDMITVGYDGKLRADHHALDGFDLDEVAAKLRDLAARIKSADPATVPLHSGAHCRYCRALRCCPAQTALVKAAVGKLATLEEKIADLTTEQAGAAWGWYYEVSDRLEAIKSALHLRVVAGEEPILPDGRRVKAVRSHAVKKSDVAKAEIAELCEALEQRGEIVSVPTTQVRPVGRKRKS